MADRVRPDDWTPTVWTHAALMAMQARLDPVRMARYAQDWHRAVDAMRDVLVELNQRVATQLDESWRGRGADAAVTAVQRYVAGSIDGLVACRSVAVHLSELSRAAGDLRGAITPPIDGPSAGQHLDDALAQVRQLYSGPAVAAGNAVAEIPAPPEPFGIAGQATASVMPAAAPQTPNSPAAGAPFTAAPLESTPSSAPGPHPAAASNVPLPVTDPHPTWQAPTHSTALPSPGDAPSARPEPPSTTPSPVAAGPLSAPGQAPRVGARATQPFSPFLGAPYPGYGGRDDGAEHRAPRYLISAGHTNELIGELPLVAPPVIGE